MRVGVFKTYSLHVYVSNHIMDMPNVNQSNLCIFFATFHILQWILENKTTKLQKKKQQHQQLIIKLPFGMQIAKCKTTKNKTKNIQETLL